MPVSTVTPCLRYRDAPAAIDWLCTNFGFTRHLVVPGEGRAIMHAQLTHGKGMLMLGSTGGDTAYGLLMKQPDEIGGAQTQTVCLYVDNPDQIYAQAKAAGATIIIDIENHAYGGRGFTCSDLEGHVWTLSSYDPWA